VSVRTSFRTHCVLQQHVLASGACAATAGQQHSALTLLYVTQTAAATAVLYATLLSAICDAPLLKLLNISTATAAVPAATVLRLRCVQSWLH
jgi:hypothetical protein